MDKKNGCDSGCELIELVDKLLLWPDGGDVLIIGDDSDDVHDAAFIRGNRK